MPIHYSEKCCCCYQLGKDLNEEQWSFICICGNGFSILVVFCPVWLYEASATCSTAVIMKALYLSEYHRLNSNPPLLFSTLLICCCHSCIFCHLEFLKPEHSDTFCIWKGEIELVHTPFEAACWAFGCLPELAVAEALFGF